ncbi:MAG: DNA-3-methyladenine glycosylase 2 family protein [Microthrixaceae bacterium]|nr:DNA-3-methyladenine glycosylase 2 family protein [Microthrixaceae bacterium]
MFHDFERCYRAVQSRDARFDGWFVTAVNTTGIYCRPSCPARTPKPTNLTFFPTAAAAQRAGYRACKRCRPDASPGSPEWNARQDVVARAMRLIADGVVDRGGVPDLAMRLGYSQRQLERLLVSELGAGPLAIARAQRSQTARVLIETTTMPFGEVAFGAGFSSIRQFNDTVQSVFAVTPTEMRRRPIQADAIPTVGEIQLRLPYREPFDPAGVFDHLAANAVPGLEELREGAFRRTLRLPHGPGLVALRPGGGHVSLKVHLHDNRDLTTAIARCRRLLDLDADPEAVTAHLSEDPALTTVVNDRPGQRLPGTVDPHELAIRVVIGQQVSLGAAATHSRRLTETHGTPIASSIADHDGSLTHLFPTSEVLAELDPTTLAMPRSRARAVVDLARSLAQGKVDLDPGSDPARSRHQLASIAGIGPWTCEMVALRGLGDPDAFPATDLGVTRTAACLGLPTKAGPLTAHAETWRPWRSYAVTHLWSHRP